MTDKFDQLGTLPRAASPVVLRSQGQVGAERLGHVLVEICWKWQRGVQIEDQTPVRRRIVHEEDVVVLLFRDKNGTIIANIKTRRSFELFELEGTHPYHNLIVATSCFLAPQGHRATLVGDEDGVALRQLLRARAFHLLAELPHIFLAGNTRDTCFYFAQGRRRLGSA